MNNRQDILTHYYVEEKIRPFTSENGHLIQWDNGEGCSYSGRLVLNLFYKGEHVHIDDISKLYRYMFLSAAILDADGIAHIFDFPIMTTIEGINCIDADNSIRISCVDDTGGVSLQYSNYYEYDRAKIWLNILREIINIADRKSHGQF